MNYYERHIGDYLKDTAHLSLLEHGIYARLLDVYYTRETGIPADEAARLIGARSKEEREALAGVLRELFVLADGIATQARCAREIERYQRKADHNREVGKLGGRPRKAETQTEPPGLSVGYESGTHAKPKANPPRSQKPEARSQKPSEGDCIPPEPPAFAAAASPPKAPAARPKSELAPTAATWSAYAEAYELRHGVAPVRNAKVNGMLAQLLTRLPADEAPAVAAFYVGHKGRFYVEKGHAVDYLLRDAEKLRTEWATGRQVTATQAMQGDRTQTTANVFGPMIAEARAREAVDG